MGTVGMPASGADPFDAGPYARLQAALGRRRPWVERAVSRAVVLALVGVAAAAVPRRGPGPCPGRVHRGSFTYGELALALGRRLSALAGTRLEHRGRRPLRAGLLGHHHLYSIAANVRSIRLMPWDLMTVLGLLTTALLPFAPLLLTVVPFDEIVQFTSKLVL